MNPIQKFDAHAALNAIRRATPAKVAKVAKAAAEPENFSNFSNFSSPPPGDALCEPDAPPALDARRAWSDQLCQRLHAGVAHQSPPGLGRWDEAWEIVAAPSERLLDMMAEWEASGSEGDQRAARHAAEDVALAWERAARAWEAHVRRAGQTGRV